MALAVHLKATYLQMRIYIWCVIVFILLGRLAEFIVSLFTDSSSPSTILSDGNMLILVLPLIAIALPLTYFKRIVNLGASREQYFKGLLFVFAVYAAAIALINSLWFELEVNVIRNYTNTVNLIEAFHWNDFGLAGSFLYQTAFYLMAMALFGMLISGYYHPVGWLLGALLVAAIPVGTAIPSLRVHVVSFFKALLFNDSLAAGVGFNLLLYLVFVASGWLFTKRRTH
jgi:predicted outer membrane lipoprotein